MFDAASRMRRIADRWGNPPRFVNLPRGKFHQDIMMSI
jgi:hypothetical protein